MTSLPADSGSILPILFFFIFLVFSVGVTWWAARRTRSTETYFTADGRVTAFQNGLALSGEYLSASALLGMAGLISLVGFRGYIYSIGALASWPLILFIIAEPVRRLGKYTLTDVLAWRLRQRSVRITASCAAIPIILLYLIGQLVAGGSLIGLLFGMPYAFGVVTVGIIMLGYVLLGGMLATTWVQIIKAVLMYGGVLVLTALLLGKVHFNPVRLFALAAARQGPDVLLPGSTLPRAGQWDLFSLAIGTIFGALGMPQILTRFFTVRDVRAARMSAFYATGVIGSFHLMVLLLGFGAMALVGHDLITAAGGGGNMAIPLLARLLGGDAFFGFICGISFATVLAVVAGLALASATSFAHDIWANVVMGGRTAGSNEIRVARVAAIAIGVVAVALALLFEKANVAFLIGLSQAVAASANTPALLLALFWKGLTTRGTVASMIVGATFSLLLIMLSPMVQVGMLHHNATAMAATWWFFPLNNPGIVSLPLSLATAILVSLAAPEPAAQVKFAEMRVLLDDAPADEAASAPPLAVSS